MNFDPSLAIARIIIQLAGLALFGWGIYTLQRKQRVLCTIWLTGGIVLTLCARLLPFFVATGDRPRPVAVSRGVNSPAQPNKRADSKLAVARSKFTTVLKNEIPAPQPGNVDKVLAAPDRTARRVTYPSGDLQLAAWISKDPGDGKRHPAVIFLHGGFALGKPDWTDTQPFRDAGFVVMTPTVRGENGNPGNFELFYGEVDDAIAAGEYAANLPYVDPQKVYVTGHSIGGQLAVLVSQMNSPYRAAVAYSASALDVEQWIQPLVQSGDATQQKQVVFDHTDKTEVQLRNPLKFADDVQIPLVLINEVRVRGGHQNFASAAERAICPVMEMSSRGDHYSMLAPAIKETVPWFRFLNRSDTELLTSTKSMKEAWRTKSRMSDPFEMANNRSNGIRPKFKTSLNVSGFNDVTTGMTLEEVIEVLGETPGHYGELPRGKQLQNLARRYDNGERVKKTWSLGWIINAEFNGDGRLIFCSIQGGTNRELHNAVNSLKSGMTIEQVEAALEKPLSREERIQNQSRKIWISGNASLRASFTDGRSSGSYSSTGSDPKLRAATGLLKDKSQDQVESQIDELLKDVQKAERVYERKTWQGPGRSAVATFNENEELISIRVYPGHPEIYKKTSVLKSGTPQAEVERVTDGIMKGAPTQSELTWSTDSGRIVANFKEDKLESFNIVGNDRELQQLTKSLTTGIKTTKAVQVLEGVSKGSRTHHWSMWSTPTVSISVEFEEGLRKSSSMNGSTPEAKRLYTLVNNLKTEDEVDAALFDLRHGGAPRRISQNLRRNPQRPITPPVPHRVDFTWHAWTSDTQLIAISFEDNVVVKKISQPPLDR